MKKGEKRKFLTQLSLYDIILCIQKKTLFSLLIIFDVSLVTQLPRLSPLQKRVNLNHCLPCNAGKGTLYNAPRNLDKNLLGWKRKQTDAEPEKEAVYSRIQSSGSQGDIEGRENREPIIGRIRDPFKPVI